MFNGSAVEQVRDESIHLAFLAVVGGVGLITSFIGWLVRRDLKRDAEDKAALAESLLKLEEKVDQNKDRHGYEIQDTRIAIAPLFSRLDLDPPNYPSR